MAPFLDLDGLTLLPPATATLLFPPGPGAGDNMQNSSFSKCLSVIKFPYLSESYC